MTSVRWGPRLAVCSSRRSHVVFKVPSLENALINRINFHRNTFKLIMWDVDLSQGIQFCKVKTVMGLTVHLKQFSLILRLFHSILRMPSFRGIMSEHFSTKKKLFQRTSKPTWEMISWGRCCSPELAHRKSGQIIEPWLCVYSELQHCGRVLHSTRESFASSRDRRVTHFYWWQQQHPTLNSVNGWQHDSLLFGETSAVPPVAGEVFKLVGVDGDEHQHGVGHNQPPEELQQTPPQRVVDLRDTPHSPHQPASSPATVRWRNTFCKRFFNLYFTRKVPEIKNLFSNKANITHILFVLLE